MSLTEDCKRQFVETIVSITEEIKRDAFKKDKGSLDKTYREGVRTITSAYLKLSQKLLTEDEYFDIAYYLYFEFEKPISEYLGFAMPKMFPY